MQTYGLQTYGSALYNSLSFPRAHSYRIVPTWYRTLRSFLFMLISSFGHADNRAFGDAHDSVIDSNE